jgi:hypothetical protein
MLPHGLVRIVLYRVIAMAGLVCAGLTSVAQEQEGDRVYRFQVQEVTDQATAKPLQYTLLEQGVVHACDYVQEANCFKLATPALMGYAELKALLLTAGFTLQGTVHVSDGTVLLPATTPLEDQ